MLKKLRVSNGAGFIVALTGNIMTMPGLPKVPAANKMDIFEDGTILVCFNLNVSKVVIEYHIL